MSYDEKTVRDVYVQIMSKLTDEEKNVLYFMIGKLLENSIRIPWSMTLKNPAWNNLGLSDVEKRARMTYIDL